MYNDFIYFKHINSIYNNIYDIEYFNDIKADHCTYILNNYSSFIDNYSEGSRQALKDLLFSAGFLFDLPYKNNDSAKTFQQATVMTDSVDCSWRSTVRTPDGNTGVRSNDGTTVNTEVIGEHANCFVDNNVKRSNDVFTIYVGLGKHVVLALADSGAVYSSIHPDLVRQLDIPTHGLPYPVYGKGIGGEYLVDRFIYEKITLHDLRFDHHPFKVNKCGASEFVIVLGADFFRKFELVVNPANRSIGRQVGKNSFWELVMDTRSRKCRRKLYNLPVQVNQDINVKMVCEEMYDFKIKLKDIELLQEKICQCDNQVVDELNKVIVFNPTYSDFVNSVLHNHEINVSNRGDVVPNLILNPIITNVQFPKFTVAKHCFSNKSIIYKGTTIGSVTSPLCKVIDADSPIRLNGSLLKPDIDLSNSSFNLNEKSVNFNYTINNSISGSDFMNSTFINGKDRSRVDSTLQSVSNVMDMYDSGIIDELFREEHTNYDLMPPSELDRGGEFEDDELQDEWTREELEEKLIIKTDDPVWKQKFKDLLYNYREVFSKGEYAKGCKLPETKIELLDKTPVYIPQFRVNPSLDKEIETLMNEMIEGGIVKKSNSPWNWPAMFIRKRAGPSTFDKDGNEIKPKAKLRFLLDLRVCNARAKLFHFPLPSVSGLLEQTAGFKVFSGGDLCNGFFQCPIDEASSRIISWTTGTGRYSLKSLTTRLCKFANVI